jgi:Ricin-type beta-trefoil lectin domain-like
VEGTSLDQWQCGNGQANQQWQFIPLRNGVYQVQSRYVNMSWNVTGGESATANYTPIQLWSYGGDTNEQWRATYLRTDSNGNNVYKFVAQNSAACLDVPGSSVYNGQQLDEYGCNGSNAQAFALVKVNPAQGNYPNQFTDPVSQGTAPYDPNQPYSWANLVYAGTYFAQNLSSFLCLDSLGGTPSNGTKADEYNCAHGPSQQWDIWRTPDGYYVLASAPGFGVVRLSMLMWS